MKTNGYTGQYWIGIYSKTPLKGRSTWRWIDESEPTFTDWGRRDTSTNATQCGRYYVSRRSSSWYDEQCTKKMGYVCEKLKADCPVNGRKCRMRCAFGTKTDTNGCPLPCECNKSPCEEKQCNNETVCVLEKRYGQAVHAFCRMRNKAGVCPTSSNSNPTNMLNAAGNSTNGCNVDCTDDSNCENVMKCCPGSCGASCVMPKLNDKSSCVIKRETAIQSGQTWFIPQCTTDGLYKKLQCKKQRNAKKICVCVNQKTGDVIGEDTGDENMKCSDTLKLDCPGVMCMMYCEFRFKNGADGCPICACNDDPCMNQQCADGEMCHLLYLGCPSNTNCPIVATCIDSSWVNNTCPVGSPLMKPNSPQPIRCEQSDRCQDGYTCTLQPAHNVKICCPQGPEAPDRDGSCPSADWGTYLHHHINGNWASKRRGGQGKNGKGRKKRHAPGKKVDNNHSHGVGTGNGHSHWWKQTCQKDADCPIPQKCCKSATRAPPVRNERIY
jgi:hypothetical protein